jgi:RHS repeat-associated protein
MSRRPAAAPRPLSRLRRWLRHAWVSRLDLLAWWGGLGEWLRGPDERPKERRPRFRPDMELLETRETPDDLLGLLQVPLVVGGVPLIFGTLPTPGGALLRGWSGAWGAAPSETPPLAGAATGPLDAGLSTSEETALLSAWQLSSEQTAAPGLGATGAGAVDTAQLNSRSALAVGATGLEPLRLSGLPRTAEDLLGNPLGDDWLASVGAALEAARTRRAGPAAPDDHSGGGGGSGDSGPGSPMADRGSLGGGGGPAAPPAVTAAQAAAMLGAGVATPAVAAASPQAVAQPGPAPTATPAVPQPQPPPAVVPHPGPLAAALRKGYGVVPLPFEPNVGQTDPQVRFLSRGPGFGLFLTDAGATFEVPQPASATGAVTGFDVFRMQLQGANPHPQVVGQGDLLSRSNYFGGPDPSQWRTDVPNYGEVVFKDVYPGIDLDFHSASGRQLEYDFVVAPGADPSEIQLGWQGLNSVTPDGRGDLLLATAGGTVTEQAPAAYQLVGGARVPVPVQQALPGGSQVGFQAGAYDRSQPLVIDPVLSYSSYLGGSGNDQAFGIAVDGAGDAYLTGRTTSANFPTTTGAVQTGLSGTQSGFITKLNAQGSAVVYSTYIDGATSNQGGNGIAVDLAGDAYVVGNTGSGFPTTPGAYQTTGPGGSTTAYVAKLNATGDDLLYATYLGPATSTGQAIAVDALGDAYVTGGAAGGFPTTSGAFQTTAVGTPAYVTELNPAGSALVYSGLLGGTATGTSAVGYGIAVDGAGSAYVTGSAQGDGGLPTTSGAFQTSAPNSTSAAFVTKVSAGGAALAYSTYLGGAGADYGYALGVDRSGHAFVTGSTTSTNFPTTSGAAQTSLPSASGSAFVTELNAAGSALAYSTYLGGGGTDQGNGVAVGPDGLAWVTGMTGSTNFPTTSGALQGSSGGGNDAFLTKLTSAGALAYSSYLGGSGSDSGNAVALDPVGSVYLAGMTASTNFPVAGAFQGSNAGSKDAFAAKVLLTPAAPAFTGVTTDTGSSSADQITTSQNLHLLGTAAPAATVTLYRSDLGVLGSTTADGTTGAWNFDYSGTTLAEGTYAFTATETVSGLTSAASGDYLVTVDRTAPTVVLTAPAATATRGPQVRVTASDLNGLPNAGGLYPSGVTVTLDVDTNNDGNFTDAGESGYATATLVDGTALITVPTLAAAGTYPMRARVTDLAGNQGTSGTATVVVSSVTSWGTDTAQVLSADPQQGLARQQLGDVQVRHALDLDQSPGTAQSGSPALVFNSDAVSVKPFVQVSVPSANNAALPSTISTQLTFNGVVGATATYSTSGFSPGDTFVLAAQSPTTITTTGRYGWSVTVAVPGQTTQTLTGAAYVVAQDASPFGAGWTFSPVDTLVNIAADSNGPAGQLRVFGTGEWRFYQDLGGGAFQSPAGDNGTLSKTGNTYTYSTPDGRTWTFNSSGQETSWASADGQQTLQFRYSGSLLTGMTAIDGALSTFAYSGGLLQTIQAVNSRTTSFAYSGTNLTQVTNPDAGVHTFAYDANHRLTGETFANLQNGWAYTSAGTLGTFTWGGSGSPSATVVAAAVAQGLSTPVAGAAQASSTDPNSHTTRWQLDAQGRPLQTIAPDGGLTQDAYSNGFLTAQTDPLGRATTYALDGKGYVTQETLPDGSTVSMQYQSAFHALTTYTNERGYNATYTYDGQGHKLTQTNALGQTTSYTYNAAGELTKTTDPLGHATSYAYDSARRLTAQSDPLGDATTYTYDANGNQQTVTDARGNVMTTAYDVMGRLTAQTDALGNTTSYTYNAAGLRLTMTDPLGNQTSTVYDGFNRGLVLETVQAVGSGVQEDNVVSYDNAGQVSGQRNADGWWTTLAYDPVGRQQSTTDPLGYQQKTLYDLAGQALAARDQLGRWAQSAYNQRGWVTQKTDALGDVSTMAYDRAGDLTSATDPLSHTKSYQFDALNRQTVATDALSHSVTTTFDAAGNVSTVTDQNGHVTSYAYDAANRRTTTTRAVGTSVQRSLSTGYDPVGNAITQTDGLGHTVTYTFDKDNRQVAVQNALSNTTTAAYDKASNQTSVTDPLNKTTSYAYDALNRPVASTDPLSHTTTTVLDAEGNAAGALDPLLNVSQSPTDPLGRVIRSLDANGGLTQKTYDAVGNLVSLADPVGNQTQFVYDGLNRQVREIDPAGNATTAYDAAGRTTSVIDRDGRTQKFSYDAADRLTAATWLSAANATVNLLTYSYDPKGNLLSAADYHGTVSYGYDALDRVQTYANVFGQVLTYAYDAADRQTQRADSLGGVLTSVYDNANRLTSRQFGGSGQTQARVDLGYTNSNQLGTITRFTDVAGTTVVGTTVYGYDSASQVTAITNKNGSSATLSYYDYGYDSADRVTAETWNSGGTGGTHTYAYDRASQLTNDGTTAYSYDANGNRTMAGYQTGAANRTTNDGTYTYTYDSAGNLTGKSGAGQTWAFGYDNLNHLATLQETTSTGTQLQATYTYDVQGKRVEQDVWTPGAGLVTTRYAYDGGQVWAELSGTNVVQTRYLWGQGQTQLFARTDVSVGLRWELTDHLGSVRDVVSADGTTVLDHVEYGGFGAIASETNSSNGGSYVYTGLRLDRATGILWADNRTLLVTTGQWMQEDPIQFQAGDANVRRYAGNDPTNLIDPSGLEDGDAPGANRGRFRIQNGGLDGWLSYSDKFVIENDYGFGFGFLGTQQGIRIDYNGTNHSTVEWLQFVRGEVWDSRNGKDELVSVNSLQTTIGEFGFDSDPDKRLWKVDSASNTTPFYGYSGESGYDWFFGDDTWMFDAPNVNVGALQNHVGQLLQDSKTGKNLDVTESWATLYFTTYLVSGNTVVGYVEWTSTVRWERPTPFTKVDISDTPEINVVAFGGATGKRARELWDEQSKVVKQFTWNGKINDTIQKLKLAE